MNPLDDTHDAALRSWLASANEADTEFPIQNLPFGRFRRAGSVEPWRVGVAIGDQVLDLKLACEQGGWTDEQRELFAPLAHSDLKPFMASGPRVRRSVRGMLSLLLRDGSAWQEALEPCLVPQSQTVMGLPCEVGDYTDFYTGIHHATAVGKLFRPDQPLLPNYKHVPIGYHGRSSSLCASGQDFHRPRGQTKGDAPEPQFGPCERLDYELELGALIGQGNELGQPIAMANAEQHLFGLVLLNDWSARDVQAWEYQPLGPFLAKNFATTLSPWVVTMDALAPFRVPFARPAGDPAPLPYLDSAGNRVHGAIDIVLETWLQTAAMRDRGEPAVRLMQSNFRDAYWTLAQLVAHHTSNGCNLRPGDLFGSGTQSGPLEGQGGSLLELTQGGKRPITLPGGDIRTFLEDGDTVILRAFCEAPGHRRIGFGDCAATVLRAIAG
jgi:fumarylacetoacetase